MNNLLLLLWIALGFAPTKCWITTNSYCSRLRCESGRNGNASFYHRIPNHRQLGKGSKLFMYNKELSVDSTPIKNSLHGRFCRNVVSRQALAIATVVLVLLLVGPRLAIADSAVVATTISHPLVAASAPIAVSTTTEAVKTVATTITPKLEALCTGPVLSIAMEVRLSLRLIVAALVGALVGWERSSSKHAAGVRTLSLVSMAAAAYTICSSFGFAGFGRVDPSRMAANVASGVGFIGAGVITTSTIQQRQDDNNGGNSKYSLPSNTVHGLTTAAAIWLSAAVGVACGVGLYVVATTAALTTIAILRLGRVKPSLPIPHLIKAKSRKQPGNPKNVDDKGTNQRKISSRDLPSTTMLPNETQMKSTLEFIDEEMELVVRSAWQNATATENSSMFSKDGMTNFAPSSRSTSLDSSHPEASP